MLFQDARFVVLDKPRGVPVHGGPRGGATVEDWFPALSRRRDGPWLVHRLDADTSGCLVIAVRRAALHAAQAEFAAGRAEKVYWAVVEGVPVEEAGVIDAPLLKRMGRAGWRMVVDTAGQAAATGWRVLGRGSGTTWLELRPRTGRTHQIRVHCASMGWPLLGDAVYGREGGGGMQLLARSIRLALQPEVAAVAGGAGAHGGGAGGVRMGRPVAPGHEGVCALRLLPGVGFACGPGGPSGGREEQRERRTMSFATTLHTMAARPDIRRIGLVDVRAALSAGVADFLAIPTQLVFLCLLYPVVGIVAARAATDDLLPLLFPLTAGLSLMGPVLAVGLYELSRRREAGLPASWLNAFDVLRSPAILSIAGMGALLFLVFVAWIVAARVVFAATMGSAPAGMGGFADAVLHTGAGHRLIVVGNLVGAAFALLVLMISVVSIPMLLDRNCGIAVAIQTSVRAVLRNPVAMGGWGVVVAGLLALGSVPFFIGLAVTMPILGHATWHLYRRVVA